MNRYNVDENTPFTVRLRDWDADGTHDFIGEAKLTLHDLLITNGAFALGLRNKSAYHPLFSSKPLPILPSRLLSVSTKILMLVAHITIITVLVYPFCDSAYSFQMTFCGY